LIHHDTGEIRYVRDHGVPVMDAAGRMMRIDGIVTDVTEQRLAQQALLEREERYRRLVQVSPDAIFINRGDCITFINAQGLTLLGAAHREMVLGKSPYDIFHPDSHAFIKDRISPMPASSGDLQPLEEKVIRLDGVVVDVEVTAAPFVDQGGAAVQIVLRDISERKRADRRCGKANRASAARLSAISSRWERGRRRRVSSPPTMRWSTCWATPEKSSFPERFLGLTSRLMNIGITMNGR
jgi:PAS domain S-box-containing protein